MTKKVGIKEGFMIIHSHRWLAFERNFQKQDKINFKRALRIMDELYRESLSLYRGRPRNPLEGLDVCIRIAKAVNSV